jgi:hypothetical protein
MVWTCPAGLCVASQESGCADGDGDGAWSGGCTSTSCGSLDCDDADPIAYPGGAELCGGTVDNDCDLITSSAVACSEGEVYVANVGDDQNPGTQEKPLRTITAGLAMAQMRGAAVDVRVAGGHYLEDITMLEGHSLHGGYRCRPGDCDWSRPMDDTAILAQSAEAVVAPPTITEATVFSGFRVQGKSGVSSVSGVGAAAMRIEGSPTVRKNTINGPTVSASGSSARSIALLIIGGGPATGSKIEQNEIVGGPPGPASESIGVLLMSSSAGTGVRADFTDNTIGGGNGNGSRGVRVVSTDGTRAPRFDYNRIAAATPPVPWAASRSRWGA